MTGSGPYPTRKPPVGRRWLWAAIAVAAVAALVAGFLLTRALTGVEAPSPPTGLHVRAGEGKVTATWDPVDDADSYQLLRGDLVVYSGSKPEGVDSTVTQGRQTYRVRAVRSGVVSAPSDPIEITAGPGWGLYAPLIAQYPALLPQSPDGAGWDGTHCVWLLNGSESERGPSQTGSGQMETVMRIRCATAGYGNAFGIFWFTGKDALNATFAAYAPDGQPVSWAHGTGVVDTGQGRAMMKIADDPQRALSVIVIVSVYEKLDRDQLVAFANRMPIRS